MITKIYSYKLAPNTWDAFLQVQKQADVIYSRHVQYEIKFVRDSKDPLFILEIQTFKDPASAAIAEGLHAVEPELKGLFAKFAGMLDPDESEIEQIIGESFSPRA